MKRLRLLSGLLSLTTALWLVADWGHAATDCVMSSYPPSQDTVIYNVTIKSVANPASPASPIVQPGVYTFHFGAFGDPQITVNADGTIQNTGYYGLPAVFSSDNLSVRFTASASNSLYAVRDHYNNYTPPYPIESSAPYSQPDYVFLDNTQNMLFYVTGPPSPAPQPNKLVWLQPQTIKNIFYHDGVTVLFGLSDKIFMTWNGTSQITRPPKQVIHNYVCNLVPGSDQSPPDCEKCNTCPGMAGYSLDRLRGSLRITDTPVSYSAPVGGGVAFTISYNQTDLGQAVGPSFSNMGAQWTYGWLTYISNDPQHGDVTRFVPGGGLEYYPSFTSLGASAGPGGSDAAKGTNAVSDPERNSRAVLNWDPINQKYTRTLPDGASEVYGHPVGDPSGVTDYLITSSVDAQGNALIYGYDATDRLVTITDTIGQVTTLRYDNTDPYKITRVTDPFGRSASFQYDSQGRLVSSTDTIGMVSAFGYDGSTTFVNALTTPYGTTTFTTDSDAVHHGVSATNPLGQTERVEVRYNSVSTIADTDTKPAVTGLLGATSGLSQNNTYYWTRRQYSSPLDYTQASITHWMMGPRGLTNIVDSRKQPLEDRVWYNYQGQTTADFVDDTSSALPTITARLLDPSPPGALSASLYQANYATYSSTGMITQSIDPRGRTTNYTYDSNGIDLLTVKQVNGGGQDTLSTMTYNSLHQPLTVTDAAGQVTTMTYNGQGQLLTRKVVVNGSDQVTTMAYHARSGSGTGNYLTTVTGPVSGATTGYTYDSVGRVATVTDSEGYVVTTAYDNLDRATTVTYPDTTTDQTVYRNLDVVKTIDRQGRATTRQYDAIRELLCVTDPLGRSTKYSWCTCGGLATLTDANGHVTTWSLDIQGRVTSKIYADTSHTDYVYEANTSRLHTLTDANGSVATYTYNLDNTLNSTSYAAGSGISATPNVGFTYDTVYNRVTAMVEGTGGTGTTTYTYNAVNGALGAGRLGSVSVPIAGGTATVTYTYDELGRATGRAIDQATTNGNNMATTFDALGRVTGVSNALGAFTYAYVNQTSRLSGVTFPSGTGLSTAYSYFNNAGDQRLQTIQNFKGSGSTNVSKFDYTYNAVGTIATWTQQADSATAIVNTLSYDGADQLTGAVQSGGGSASNVYGYDPAGNRLSETTGSGTAAGQFNNLNQLTGYTASGTAQTIAGYTSTNAASAIRINSVPATLTSATNFTANVSVPAGTNVVTVVAQPATGRPTTKRFQIVATGTAPTTLTYDANGNTTTDENGNTYTWDALNRLKQMTYPGGAYSVFVYDGLSRRVGIIEHDATMSHNVTSTKNYLWVGQEIVEERNGSNGVTKRFFPQGEQQGETPYYYLRDHLGSVRELMDGSGTILTRYTYDPYGRTTTNHLSGSVDATFQFTGDYYHALSGLNFTYYRAYDSNTGKWLSRDPADEKGGANLYAYVGNDPTGLIDILGLQGCEVQIRCGNVMAGFRHCGVYLNGKEYGLGGDAGNPKRTSPSGGGSTLFWGGGIPKPYADPAPNNPDKGIKVYRGVCECPCDVVQKCFEDYQKNTAPPPYAAIAGPNSNTYLHKMLQACKCKVYNPVSPKSEGAPGNAPNW